MDAVRQRSRRPIRKTLLQEFFNLPNILTLARIVVIPAVCLMMLEDTLVSAFLATVLYSAAALTDWIDGYLARRSKQITLIGKFLDPLADKLIVLSILLTLLAMKRMDLWIVAVILAREITITGLRAIASSEGLVIDAKPLGKYKTAFQMIALVGLVLHYPYVINFGIYIGEFDFHRMGMVFLYLSLVFSITSAIDYFSGFLRELKRIRASRDEEAEPTADAQEDD
ncbi:MAG: CDP-diacylglycerol--glycerol-3-phosphate 3-phosphatidyltransferase [Myxococcales bacterium]|nr:MAG: CDP-diacylglycerol--glycerol-3-phosphate 3-phosphatidyltransferase [Myxococcales bacterium]